MNLSNIIVKADYVLTILSIMSKIVMPKQSSNMTEDIRFRTKILGMLHSFTIIGQLIL